MTLRTKKYIIFFMIFQFFIVSGLVPTTRAAFISTETLIGAEAKDITRAQIQTLLSRDDVRAELIQLGVEPDMAEKRIAALTPSELQFLQHHLDELPAGAGALALIGAVFLVLLILELVGVINVFTKI
jgi:hypothetical protein